MLEILIVALNAVYFPTVLLQIEKMQLFEKRNYSKSFSSHFQHLCFVSKHLVVRLSACVWVSCETPCVCFISSVSRFCLTSEVLVKLLSFLLILLFLTTILMELSGCESLTLCKKGKKSYNPCYFTIMPQ